MGKSLLDPALTIRFDYSSLAQTDHQTREYRDLILNLSTREWRPAFVRISDVTRGVRLGRLLAVRHHASTPVLFHIVMACLANPDSNRIARIFREFGRIHKPRLPAMPCRIGISMNPDRRRREWKRVHPALHNWKILGRYNSKSEAQAQENLLAQQYGCAASPGGEGRETAEWYVYYFEF